jgi:hypothetical protein
MSRHSQFRTVQMLAHGLHQAGYTLAVLLLAFCCWLFKLPTLVTDALILVGTYLLSGNLMSWITQARQGTIQAYAVSDWDGEWDIGANDVVHYIDLGDGVTVQFICSDSLLSSCRECVERILRSIRSDRQGFKEKFMNFRTANMNKLPRYANSIFRLQIQSLKVLAQGQGKCVAVVRFAGKIGEMWACHYTGESFSDLIWL